MTTLEEYKTKLRTVLIRVAAEEGYCDNGLNDVLQELELPTVSKFVLPVRVNGHATKLVIRDAQTEDEAKAILADPDKAKAILGQAGYWFGDGPVELEVIEPPAQPAPGTGVPLTGDSAPAEGTWYATSVVSGGPNQCRVDGYVNGNLYCTRPLGHAADWHVAAGKNAGVLEVWPAKEGDVRSTPTPEMPAVVETADGVEHEGILPASAIAADGDNED